MISGVSWLHTPNDLSTASALLLQDFAEQVESPFIGLFVLVPAIQNSNIGRLGKLQTRGKNSASNDCADADNHQRPATNVKDIVEFCQDPSDQTFRLFFTSIAIQSISTMSLKTVATVARNAAVVTTSEEPFVIQA